MTGKTQQKAASPAAIPCLQVYQQAPVGLMVVQMNTALVSANDYLFKSLQLPYSDANGVMFGDMFPCANAKREALSCGYTSKCKNCDIRNSLNSILKDGAVLDNIPLCHEFVVDGTTQIRWFQVNGCPMQYNQETFALLSFSDITAAKQHTERLEQQVVLDLATGALNKYSLMDSLCSLMNPRHQVQFTVCMIDFDDFKDVNDQYGHLMGDQVLEVFSSISRKMCGEGDLFGRYGGEEFMLVLKGKSEQETVETVRRIQKGVKEYFSDKMHFKVTFSCGLLFVDKRHSARDCAQLIEKVDKLLYRAKNNGKNRILSHLGEYVFD